MARKYFNSQNLYSILKNNAACSKETMLRAIKLMILIQQKVPVRKITHPTRHTTNSIRKVSFIFSKIFIHHHLKKQHFIVFFMQN